MPSPPNWAIRNREYGWGYVERDKPDIRLVRRRPVGFDQHKQHQEGGEGVGGDDEPERVGGDAAAGVDERARDIEGRFLCNHDEERVLIIKAENIRNNLC